MCLCNKSIEFVFTKNIIRLDASVTELTKLLIVKGKMGQQGVASHATNQHDTGLMLTKAPQFLQTAERPMLTIEVQISPMRSRA